MKKIVLITLSLFVIYSVNAQNTESEKGRLSFGFNMGVGQNTNGYRLTADDYGHTYSEGGIHFTSGFNLSYFITERIRPRVEFRYSEMIYRVDWSATYPDFDHTKAKLNTLNLNLNVDFLALSGKNIQLFVSPGIVTEYNINYGYKTYLEDGSTSRKNYNVLTDQYPDAIAGANISLIGKYKLTDNFGFVLIPGYNYYFKNFVSSNDKKFSKKLLNFGIEYTF